MRPDEPSATAILVALGRAAADRQRTLRVFSDPIAVRLLPERYVRALDRIGRVPPSSWRERRLRWLVRRLARWAPLRTLAIDDALRGALGEGARDGGADWARRYAGEGARVPRAVRTQRLAVAEQRARPRS